MSRLKRGVRRKSTFCLHVVQECLILETMLSFAKAHFIGEAYWFVSTELSDRGLEVLKLGKTGFGLLSGSSSKKPAAHESSCVDHRIVGTLVLSEAERVEVLSGWLFFDPTMHFLHSQLVDGKTISHYISDRMKTYVFGSVTKGDPLSIHSAHCHSETLLPRLFLEVG